ncbi:MAG: DUF1643 domain-containing protein [Gemmatimonadetes bacterium]|nr:DUF1643 domain-containing protein [Gemmatimonadota bacterium]MCC6771972.1 DUF1643 domain-containing protein [Gemmatimonadaceae bacterium]
MPDIVGAAHFSRCGRYRYALWRTWDASRPACCFIALNPSTADATRDDPTMRRCIAFAKRWGFGGMSVGNIFAFRATRPADMKAEPSPIGRANDRWLQRLAAESPVVVAAWGSHGAWMGRDARVLQLLGAVDCLGVTASGAPRHPLYVRGDTPRRPFRP